MGRRRRAAPPGEHRHPLRLGRRRHLLHLHRRRRDVAQGGAVGRRRRTQARGS
jgi:hypothetical protein